MKIFLSLSLLVFSLCSWATDPTPLIKAVNQKYCEKGLKLACEFDSCMHDPSKCPTPGKDPSKDMERALAGLEKCKGDQACIFRFLDEARKEPDSKCKQGSLEDCWSLEVTDINMKSLKSLLEAQKSLK